MRRTDDRRKHTHTIAYVKVMMRLISTIQITSPTYFIFFIIYLFNGLFNNHYGCSIIVVRIMMLVVVYSSLVKEEALD
jgi:hypothetical protein